MDSHPLQGVSYRNLSAVELAGSNGPNLVAQRQQDHLRCKLRKLGGHHRIVHLTTHQISTVPGSLGRFSPRWSPDGRYAPGLSSDLARLFLFDFQTQKWTEVAKGSLGWPWFSKDGPVRPVEIARDLAT